MNELRYTIQVDVAKARMIIWMKQPPKSNKIIVESRSFIFSDSKGIIVYCAVIPVIPAVNVKVV